MGPSRVECAAQELCANLVAELTNFVVIAIPEVSELITLFFENKE